MQNESSECGEMEESLNHQNGSQMGGPQNNANNKQGEKNNPKPQYSIPGILHFIQHEWARFELERSQWEVDKAELQARIAFLQGERKGQENLKNDLVRRIKMLEYALKQERAKFHKLKYGVDLQQGDIKPPVLDDPALNVDSQLDSEAPYTSVSNASWRQGRQLLRQYLQEIGYTDRIIDVRSTRVRALLGLNNNAEQEENLNGGSVNCNESNKRASDTQDTNTGRRTPAKKPQPSVLAESMMLDTEAAVMANLDFLSNPDVDMEDEDDMSDEVDLETQDEIDDDVKSVKRKDDVDAEAMEVLNELNLLSESEDQRQDINKSESGDWNKPFQPTGQPGRRTTMGMNDDENIDAPLGELAQLTVNNEAESTYDMASSKESFRKAWNAKYTLRSHFDGVRSLAFHPTEPVLITASEDHTLKLWNLQKTVPAKKSASLDVEPLYTFRSHQGPVLCLAMSASGEQCFSGGLDGYIHCWNTPSCNIDPYDLFEPEVLEKKLEGHTDAVWGLAMHHNQTRELLLSCSADGTVRLWQPKTDVRMHDAETGKMLYSNECLNWYQSKADGIPSSVDFCRDDPTKMVAAFSSANCVIFDIETNKPVVVLEGESSAAPRLINRVVCHPTIPLTVTAHEDRHIRFWDNNTGKMVHSMVAHLDAVTSLAVDPNGLYLLSGSHDCSIRLWHMDNKTCVQEITAHRKKFDESILDVAFHPSRPYIASAGADGLAKVFV
ncbi:PREDICTED: striatin-3 isoform X2 [Nicrophorus vespilloides]|uniref:Striatin-3 isoform X2 n=1 Tax=Nicrophorus vespilloides TaxID=110193 RepID=A0ABM1MEI6_NICVS|nr:PREDICTED: striatin-3 isoform X2 [Nicrophorus vespilloides]